MKKTMLAFLAVGLLIATPSCKKGENDPFLSLKSRKARIAGDWSITGFDYTNTFTQADGDNGSNTGVLNGDVITFTNTFTSGGTTVTSTSTTTINDASYTFTKEGTYTAVWNTTTVDVQTNNGFTTTTTDVEKNTTTGDWSFIGKQKKTYKNKERIVLNALKTVSSSQTTDVTVDDSGTFPTITNVGDLDEWENNYASGEESEVWELDMLKGKEMVAKIMTSNSGSQSTTPDGGSTTTVQNDVSESTTTITFTKNK